MALSKEQILGLDDIQTKEIEVPIWNDTVFIRQLTRGQQDEYMKRRFSKASMKQQIGKREQEVGTEMTIFGHDSWLVTQGLCDEKGERLFSNSEVKELEKKNGEAIGFIAQEILKFSDMAGDVEKVEEAEVKN